MINITRYTATWMCTDIINRVIKRTHRDNTQEKVEERYFSSCSL